MTSFISNRIARSRRNLLMAAAVALLTPMALAQSGAANVQVLVPWPAGGVVDLVARMVLPRMSTSLGSTMLVINRPGAGGTVGSEAVVKAAPNGNTLLITSSAMAMNQALLGSRLPFDMSTDLIPIGAIASAPMVIVTSASNSKLTSVSELVKAAKVKPGALNYATAGNGSPAHMGTELLKSMSSTFITHVPYRGAPEALTASVSGEADFFMSPVPPALPLIQAGRLRAVAVTSPTRTNALPDVPTVAESGYPGFEASQWIGIFVPKGTPVEVQTRLSTALLSVVADPAFKSEIAKRGLDAVLADRDTFTKMISADLKRWGDVVRRAKITAD